VSVTWQEYATTGGEDLSGLWLYHGCRAPNGRVVYFALFPVPGNYRHGESTSCEDGAVANLSEFNDKFPFCIKMPGFLSLGAWFHNLVACQRFQPCGKARVTANWGGSAGLARSGISIVLPRTLFGRRHYGTDGRHMSNNVEVSRASKVRGHIGDTIRCFLLLLLRHLVRSRSCGLLELRLAIPLSRR
jgi:hypothetical protein